jgi:hypothetical protein
MMSRTWKNRMLFGALGLLGVWAAGARPAHAQMNTYADVPFNQGSLFYRPSGARPPAAASSPRGTRAPAYPYGYVPQGGTTYYYPSTGTYYYPQYQYVPRRGLFGRYRY